MYAYYVSSKHIGVGKDLNGFSGSEENSVLAMRRAKYSKPAKTANEPSNQLLIPSKLQEEIAH